MRQNRQPDESLLVRSLALGLPAGFKIEPHTHSWPQLVFAEGGTLCVESEKRLWIVPPQRAVWVVAEAPHQLRTLSQTSLRTLYLEPGWSSAWAESRETHVMQVSPLLRELVLHIVDHRSLGMDKAGEQAVARVLADQIAAAPHLPFEVPLPLDERARRVAERVQEAPSDRATLSELADGSGASVRTLERTFQRETGLSFGQWCRQVRLLHGACRLAQGASVTAAALAAGYESTSSFIDVFKKAFGETPAKYF